MTGLFRWTIRRTDLTRPLLDPGTTSWLEGSAAAGLGPKDKNDVNASASNKKRAKDKGNDLKRAKRGGGGLGRGQDAGTASASTLPSVGGAGSWPVSTKRNTDVSFYISNVLCMPGFELVCRRRPLTRNVKHDSRLNFLFGRQVCCRIHGRAVFKLVIFRGKCEPFFSWRHVS